MATKKKKSAAKRKKKSAVAKKAPAKKRSVGRPSLGDAARRASIAIRCTVEQREAIQQHVDELSEERAKKGQPPVDLTTWLRELALKHSGNSHLGIAGRLVV